MNRTLRIIIYSLLCCTLLYFTEDMGYILKTSLKIVGFVALPFVLGLRIPKIDTLKKVSYAPGFSFGIAVFILILGAYYFLRNVIDLEGIRTSLETGPKVTKEVYPYVAAYITFGNSFLEEYFFRGVIFLGLLGAGYRLLAYHFSAALFAVYHVVVFMDWFTIPVFMLVMLGLYVGGLLFNWLTEKGGSYINAWIFHIFADLAIVAIGAIMFYL